MDEVARSAGLLQHRAQRVGDWALARVLAESPAVWNVFDTDEARARVRSVVEAEDSAAGEDRDRLDRVLRRLESVDRAGEGRRGALAPGEMEEHARRLASSTGAPFTTHLIERLLDPGSAPGLGGILMIEVLGRKRDVQSRSGEVRAGDLVARSLESASRRGVDADRIAAWVRAGARLEGTSPGSVPGFEETLESLELRFGSDEVIQSSLARAREIVSGDPLAPDLPLPGRDPVLLRRRLGELAEEVAARVRSGTRYTAHLLERARSLDGLTDLQAAFVLGQLGLHGDPQSAGSGQDAPALLLEAFGALHPRWTADRPPSGIDHARWKRTRTLAVAAAMALSRLERGEIGPSLQSVRLASGSDSWFAQETKLAFALLPDEAWPAPGTPAELAQRGQAWYEKGDLRAAREDLDAAIAGGVRHPVVFNTRAIARMDSGDARGAIEDAAEAIALDPSNPSYHLTRGNARLALDDVAGALADLDRAIELDPGFARARVVRGLARIRAGDTRGAIEDLRRAVELAPDLAGAHLDLGYALALAGEEREAIASFDRAIELRPDDPGAYLNRSKTLKAIGEPRRALADAQRAVDLLPSSPAAYVARAEARLALEDVAGALADLDRAVELAPDDLAVRRQRIAILIESGHALQAERELDRVLERDPTDASGYFFRGLARERRSDPRAALADYDRALELDGRFANAYFNRAIVRREIDDPAGAVQDFDRYLELRPDDPDAYEARGQLRRQAGDLDAAIEDFTAALRVAPGRPLLLGQRGQARLESEDFEGAIVDLEAATAADPDLWQSWANLALALDATGRAEDARRAVDRALALCPGHARASLEALRTRLLGR